MTHAIRLVATCLLLAAAGACTLARPLAHHATSYNIAVEETQNRMLFLNVVRASQGMPMYFTDIGSITASLSYTVDSGSLGLTDVMSTVKKSSATTGQGGSTSDSRDVTDSSTEVLQLPSVSYSNKPTLAVSVRDDHEFMRGTLTPIAPRTVQSYFDQGWNEQVLLYLFVESIELSAETEKMLGVSCDEPAPCGSKAAPGGREDRDLLRIKNDPDDFDESACFKKFVAAFSQKECQLRVEVKTTSDGAAKLRTSPSLGDFLKAREAGFDVEVAAVEGDDDSFLTTVGQRSEVLRMECGTVKHGGSVDQNEEFQSSIFLRSPQGVLYYLGELLRMWQLGLEGGDDGTLGGRVPLIQPNGGDERPFPCPDDPGKGCVPLFLARKGTGCESATVAIEYRGTSYRIPALPEAPPAGLAWDLCHPGRSMQALTLVSQLLSLQKKGEELPGTALVRVVGN